MTRIIITGATGMIGANLADYAVKHGCEVLCIIRKNSPKETNIPKNDRIKIIYADISEYNSVLPIGTYDVFFHLAWEKTFGASRDDVDGQIKNIQYTLDAVRLAKSFGCNAFIGAGSQAEYGIVQSSLRSDTAVNPLSGYGVAKYTAGKLSGLLCSQLGIRHNWVRVLSVYGCMDNDFTLIMYTINTLLKGIKPSFSKCEQLWDYLNEKDAASAFFSIGQKGVDRTVYPLGSGCANELSTYLRIIRDCIDPSMQLGFGEKDYYPNQPMYLCADITELSRDTGWKPVIDFKEAIKKIVMKQSNSLSEG